MLDINLFKNAAAAVRDNKKIDLKKFSDDSKCPVYDCHPFFDIPLNSVPKHWAIGTKDFAKRSATGEYTKLEVIQYLYRVTPQWLWQQHLQELLESEMKNMEGFKEYRQWHDDLKLKEKKHTEVVAGGKYKKYYTKKELAQYRFDNAEKLF